MRTGFTLIETLVTTAIISALGGLAMVGFDRARDRARMAVEVTAARNLAIAHAGYTAANGGRLMPGYKSAPQLTDQDGELLSNPINARYPFHLVDHISSLEGALYYNGNETFLEAGYDRNYLMSVRPNLGTNAVLVGGHHGSGSPLRPSPRVIDVLGQFYAERVSDVPNPAMLIVFASARSDGGPGHFEIRPPNLLRPSWSSAAFDPKLSAQSHGFVDFRWRGKAVAASLDGSVAALTEQEMRDMRRWSIQAQEADDPDFTLGRR